MINRKNFFKKISFGGLFGLFGFKSLGLNYFNIEKINKNIILDVKNVDWMFKYPWELDNKSYLFPNYLNLHEYICMDYDPVSTYHGLKTIKLIITSHHIENNYMTYVKNNKKYRIVSDVIHDFVNKEIKFKIEV